MDKIKLLSTYNIIEGPQGGGANSFTRALKDELINNHNVEFVTDADSRYDILYMNSLSNGHSAKQSWQRDNEILDLKKVHELQKRNPRAKLVVRNVNLRRHSHPNFFIAHILNGDMKKDSERLALTNMADHSIFQSNYQYGFFKRYGYRGTNYTIIHNGAPPLFCDRPRVPPALDDNTPLRIFSSSFSAKLLKRQDIIFKLSEIPGVEVTHAGRWPSKIPAGKINLPGILPHEKMADYISQSHYFLHPAQHDVCPNSMVEALSAGVPVLYNSGPGSGTELGHDFGVAIKEHHVVETIAEARKNYQKYTDVLQRRREEFSIRRAAQDYMNVFRKVLNG